jgi:hypothetical protein
MVNRRGFMKEVSKGLLAVTGNGLVLPKLFGQALALPHLDYPSVLSAVPKGTPVTAMSRVNRLNGKRYTYLEPERGRPPNFCGPGCNLPLRMVVPQLCTKQQHGLHARRNLHPEQQPHADTDPVASLSNRTWRVPLQTCMPVATKLSAPPSLRSGIEDYPNQPPGPPPGPGLPPYDNTGGDLDQMSENLGNWWLGRTGRAGWTSGLALDALEANSNNPSGFDFTYGTYMSQQGGLSDM